MKRSSQSDSRGNTETFSATRGPEKKAALLWDESFLWGLMAYKALRAAHVSFDIIRSKDIREGRLGNYSVLFVPGGWASNKLKALEESGINEINKYVNNGGNYLGLCGGAGLATRDGIGLLNIARRPTKERVPSFSGKIRLATSGHFIWHDIQEPIFHVWWPSQFLVQDEGVKILASYKAALPDSFSSDLNVGNVEANSNWQAFEVVYQINLDPGRLIDEPAVIEGRYGKGKVILSLIHFDTPEDTNGAKVLRNLLEYLGAGCRIYTESKLSPPFLNYNPSPSALKLASEIETAVDALIDTGMRNFLWFWRTPMLLQWRRGVRGLEYCTLYVLVKEIMEMLKDNKGISAGIGESGYKEDSETDLSIEKALEGIKELLLPFVEKAQRLLVSERFALQGSHITYERCDSPEIQRLRSELFSNSKSYGGLFKRLLDRIDALLYEILWLYRIKGLKKTESIKIPSLMIPNYMTRY